VRCRGARAVTTRFERWALGAVAFVAVGCARVNGAGGAAGKGGGPAAGGGIGAPSGSAGAAAVTGPPATVTVAGDVIAATFAPDEKPALDAAAPPNAAGTIAYPTDGALFPSNWGAITIQVKKTDPAQDSGRVAISGKGIDIKYYAACETWPNSSVGCSITVPSSLTGAFAAASEAGDLTLTARLAGAGGATRDSPPVSVAWAPVALTGGLYYWTSGGENGTTINRYNFSGDATAPEVAYTEKDVEAAGLKAADGATCIGCHAISNDGTTMALTMGGSYPSSFLMVDVASKKQLTFQAPAINAGYATQTTFNHDGTRVVQMFRGKLDLRDTGSNPPKDLGPQLASITENKSDGFWSASGKLFAFASFDPAALVLAPGAEQFRQDSDLKTGARLWIANSDGATLQDPPRPLVPRKPGFTSFYPSVSDDDQLVVFNQSDCSGPTRLGTGYGEGPCDGYDDLSASLWVVPASGGAPVALARANGPPVAGNSWPRWSPDHGMFRGKRLYWVAFSSRRPYGLQVNQGDIAGSTPQLWFAAVSVGDEFSSDPSFAAIWLPGQNTDQGAPHGNHVPVWVQKAVIIVE
jgi:hypothetical protein